MSGNVGRRRETEGGWRYRALVLLSRAGRGSVAGWRAWGLVVALFAAAATFVLLAIPGVEYGVANFERMDEAEGVLFRAWCLACSGALVLLGLWFAASEVAGALLTRRLGHGWRGRVLLLELLRDGPTGEGEGER